MFTLLIHDFFSQGTYERNKNRKNIAFRIGSVISRGLVCSKANENRDAF